MYSWVSPKIPNVSSYPLKCHFCVIDSQIAGIVLISKTSALAIDLLIYGIRQSPLVIVPVMCHQDPHLRITLDCK